MRSTHPRKLISLCVSHSHARACVVGQGQPYPLLLTRATVVNCPSFSPRPRYDTDLIHTDTHAHSHTEEERGKILAWEKGQTLQRRSFSTKGKGTNRNITHNQKKVWGGIDKSKKRRKFRRVWDIKGEIFYYGRKKGRLIFYNRGWQLYIRYLSSLFLCLSFSVSLSLSLFLFPNLCVFNSFSFIELISFFLFLFYF